MTAIHRTSALVAVLVAAATACSGKSNDPTMTSDLQGDLDAARSSAVQLAPNGSRVTDVVSAQEMVAVPGAGNTRSIQKVPRLTIRKAKVGNKPTLAPAPTTQPPTVLAPKANAPIVDADTLAPIDPRPTPSRPSATPNRRGGYKSVGDVIRDAPFPINPLG